MASHRNELRLSQAKGKLLEGCQVADRLHRMTENWVWTIVRNPASLGNRKNGSRTELLVLPPGTLKAKAPWTLNTTGHCSSAGPASLRQSLEIQAQAGGSAWQSPDPVSQTSCQGARRRTLPPSPHAPTSHTPQNTTWEEALKRGSECSLGHSKNDAWMTVDVASRWRGNKKEQEE